MSTPQTQIAERKGNATSGANTERPTLSAQDIRNRKLFDRAADEAKQFILDVDAKGKPNVPPTYALREGETYKDAEKRISQAFNEKREQLLAKWNSTLAKPGEIPAYNNDLKSAFSGVITAYDQGIYGRLAFLAKTVAKDKSLSATVRLEASKSAEEHNLTQINTLLDAKSGVANNFKAEILHAGNGAAIKYSANVGSLDWLTRDKVYIGVKDDVVDSFRAEFSKVGDKAKRENIRLALYNAIEIAETSERPNQAAKYFQLLKVANEVEKEKDAVAINADPKKKDAIYVQQKSRESQESFTKAAFLVGTVGQVENATREARLATEAAKQAYFTERSPKNAQLFLTANSTEIQYLKILNERNGEAWTAKNIGILQNEHELVARDFNKAFPKDSVTLAAFDKTYRGNALEYFQAIANTGHPTKGGFDDFGKPMLLSLVPKNAVTSEERQFAATVSSLSGSADKGYWVSKILDIPNTYQSVSIEKKLGFGAAGAVIGGTVGALGGPIGVGAGAFLGFATGQLVAGGERVVENRHNVFDQHTFRQFDLKFVIQTAGMALDLYAAGAALNAASKVPLNLALVEAAGRNIKVGLNGLAESMTPPTLAFAEGIGAVPVGNPAIAAALKLPPSGLGGNLPNLTHVYMTNGADGLMNTGMDLVPGGKGPRGGRAYSSGPMPDLESECALFRDLAKRMQAAQTPEEANKIRAMMEELQVPRTSRTAVLDERPDIDKLIPGTRIKILEQPNAPLSTNTKWQIDEPDLNEINFILESAASRQGAAPVEEAAEEIAKNAVKQPGSFQSVRGIRQDGTYGWRSWRYQPSPLERAKAFYGEEVWNGMKPGEQAAKLELMAGGNGGAPGAAGAASATAASKSASGKFTPLLWAAGRWIFGTGAALVGAGTGLAVLNGVRKKGLTYEAIPEAKKTIDLVLGFAEEKTLAEIQTGPGDLAKNKSDATDAFNKEMKAINEQVTQYGHSQPVYTTLTNKIQGAAEALYKDYKTYGDTSSNYSIDLNLTKLNSLLVLRASFKRAAQEEGVTLNPSYQDYTDPNKALAKLWLKYKLGQISLKLDDETFGKDLDGYLEPINEKFEAVRDKIKLQ